KHLRDSFVIESGARARLRTLSVLSACEYPVDVKVQRTDVVSSRPLRRLSMSASPKRVLNPTPPVEPHPPEVLAATGAGVTTIVALPRMFEFRASASVTVWVPGAEKVTENEVCPP